MRGSAGAGRSAGLRRDRAVPVGAVSRGRTRASGEMFRRCTATFVNAIAVDQLADARPRASGHWTSIDVTITGVRAAFTAGRGESHRNLPEPAANLPQ